MAKQTYTIGQVLSAAEMTTLQTNDYNQTVSAKVASYTLVADDAGTRITMSNASATTITVNTSLFTAGDTLTITNIGAGVCTITAGTATVSTAGSLALNQYDSGTLYFTSTGVSIWNGANPGDITGVTAGTGISGGGTSGTVTVSIDTAVTVDKTTAQTLTNKTLTSPALTTPTISTLTTNGDLVYGTGSGALSRLGIGSSAQVLTVASGVPSWATPAGGGGMVLISRASFSSVATTGSTFEGMFTTSYFNYQIVIHKITAGTAGDDLNFNFKYGSTTYTTNTGYYSGIATYNATAANIGTITAASAILTRDCGTGNNASSGNIYMFKVGQTTESPTGTYLMINPYGGETIYGGISMDSSSFTITGFVLKSSSSNITGTVSVYAYPN